MGCRVDAGRDDAISLADILHAQKLYSTGDNFSIISVRRKHLWDDSMAQFLKCIFDTRKPRRVIFYGEEAVGIREIWCVLNQ